MISLLAREHTDIRTLLGDVQRALADPATPSSTWRGLFAQIADEVHTHFALEEQSLYGPLLRDEAFRQDAVDRVTEHGRARIRLARVRERFLAPDVESMRAEFRAWHAGMRTHLQREEALFRRMLDG